jgi:predicted amidohydrolase
MLVKLVIVQGRMGQQLTLEERIYIFKQRPDFVCLPEYFLLDESITDFHRAALMRNEYIDYLEHLSDQLSTCLIGGTVVEPRHDQLFNTCYVINRGKKLGRYAKRHPVPGEQSNGISPGGGKLVLTVEGVRIGVLICGDVFFEERFDEMRRSNVDLLFVPTTSPFRPDDSVSQKSYRDHKYFVSGAERSGAYVVKACGVGTLFGKALQGRSLIASPWGILAQTELSGESQKRLLTVTVDIGELREFRSKLPSRDLDRPAVGETSIN